MSKQQSEKTVQKKDIEPVVTVQDEKVWTSSEDVARIFGKRHDTVLRAIDRLECSENYRLRNFAETVKSRQNPAKNIEGEIKSRMVNMTRDGFVLLVMGFTGKEAMRFKEAYIEAFNRMEAELLQEKIWIAGLTRALEHICPSPPKEAPDIRNQRAMKTLRALAAYWALLEEMPLRAAESAVCVVGGLRRLEDLDLTRHDLGEMSNFLFRAVVHSDKDMQPASEEEINAVKHLVEACSQFKYTRDQDIHSLLRKEYGISIESIANATSGEAKRIAGLAYNLLLQHLAHTCTINELKRRAREAADRMSGPCQVNEGEE